MNIFDSFTKKGDLDARESQMRECNVPQQNENNETHSDTTQDPSSQTKQNEKTKQEGKAKANIYNLIIVDESGSMNSLAKATVSGVNETISTIRSAQNEFGDTQQHYLTLVTFDSGYCRPDVRTLIDRRPISEVTEFSDYRPYGSTPLYDAIGQSVAALEHAIRHDDNAIGVVTVLTDGLENASHEYSASEISTLVAALKEKGWSFAYMGSEHDVREVAYDLCFEQSIEFSHDERGAKATWERERGARSNFYRRVANTMQSDACLSLDERRRQIREAAKQYYDDRVTPEHIDTLKDNQVFVFGSNPQGIHSGGAARFALLHFGAVMGQGEGPQGRSYAIPTTGSFDVLHDAVLSFAQYAKQHPDTQFLVTAVGCGNAGRDVKQMALLFYHCMHLENVSLPRIFWEALGLDPQTYKTY